MVRNAGIELYMAIAARSLITNSKARSGNGGNTNFGGLVSIDRSRLSKRDQRRFSPDRIAGTNIPISPGIRRRLGISGQTPTVAQILPVSFRGYWRHFAGESTLNAFPAG